MFFGRFVEVCNEFAKVLCVGFEVPHAFGAVLLRFILKSVFWLNSIAGEISFFGVV